MPGKYGVASHRIVAQTSFKSARLESDRRWAEFGRRPKQRAIVTGQRSDAGSPVRRQFPTMEAAPRGSSARRSRAPFRSAKSAQAAYAGLRPLFDLQGDAHEIGEILRTDTLHHPGAVVLHGLRADVELLSDFLVRQPGDGKFHHLSLPRRQHLEA